MPVDRWLNSKDRSNNADRIVDLSIALEAFYLQGLKKELSFRFCLRGAKYLGGSDRAKRQYLKKQFKKIYDQRSAVVHGGSAAADDKDSFVNDTEELLVRSLEKAIDDNAEPNWSKIELQ